MPWKKGASGNPNGNPGKDKLFRTALFMELRQGFRACLATASVPKSAVTVFTWMATNQNSSETLAERD